MKSHQYKTVANVLIPLYVFSVFSATVYAIDQYNHKKPYPSVYKDGAINQNIVALAKIQNPNAQLPARTSLEDWNAYLQKHFLRPAGIDHQDMGLMAQDPKHAQMLPHFVALRMVDSIYPQQKKYAGVFVFGGTPNHTNQRFKFLKEIIETEQLDTDVDAPVTVTYINGNRKIVASEVEEAKELGVDCSYQHECAQKIWDLHYSGLPVNFKMLTIDPPPGRRANSDDTLKGFFTQFPRVKGKKISLLGISNVPYVPYQGDTAEAVAIREEREDLNLEVVGGKSPTEVPDITCLDSIGRRVYTELQVQAAKQKLKF